MTSIVRMTPQAMNFGDHNSPYVNFIGDSRFGACFDDQQSCYRYTLWRRFSDDYCPLSEMVAFIGLNPSTADEYRNDNTVTRCINFAKKWRFRGMVMLNIFAFRATDPNAMKAQRDPVGELNDLAIHNVVVKAGKTVCCWGVHGQHLDRGPEVERRLFQEKGFCDGSRKLFCLGLTKDGYPKHPLYIHSETEPQRLECPQLVRLCFV
jgi:hypothetical protein